ncbi:endolytic transglycosylase MltG [Hansschlegelia sp. KR7-227]|uniref:endolytic transglycosylase MltG n=1 Tax=Hansschlegelia sp. KR7-227 TaxID=3400914 RepID=UPI003C099364
MGYLSGVFTFLTLVVLALAGAFYWGKTTFDEPGPLAQETTVMIARNQGVSEIADSLQRAGVIDHPRLFELGVRAYGVKDRLRYGEYAFPAGVSMREAMVIIASGKSIEHTVTIPEGLTSLQIVDRLRDQPLLTGDVKATPPEGSLLPETYKFMRGASREQMIARMQEHQKAVLEKVWAARTPSPAIKSPDDLVTLASLIEKETGVPEERERVAAVFANRLAKGMRLQSDPTIVYGLVGGRGTLGRSLNRADIASRTPYNTYVVSGLPAGPIANPGRASLEAAANPAKTNDLYFVADGSGGHAFATTLAEHNRNVAAWRKIERSRALPADRLAPDDAAPEAPADDAPTGAAPASSSSAPAKPKPSDRRRPDVR